MSVGGETYTLENGEVLYIGMGAGPVEFAARAGSICFRLRRIRPIPTTLIKLQDARRVEMGARETANERSSSSFCTPMSANPASCLMGYTQFAEGSVWNTMPAHPMTAGWRRIFTSNCPKTSASFT